MDKIQTHGALWLMKALPTMLWAMYCTNRQTLMRTMEQVYSKEPSIKIHKNKRIEVMLGYITLQSIHKNLLVIQNNQNTQLTLHQE